MEYNLKSGKTRGPPLSTWKCRMDL